MHTPSYPAALTFLYAPPRLCTRCLAAAAVLRRLTRPPARDRPPSGAAHGPGTLLALAEASHVSLWDVRVGDGASGGGCVSRLASVTPVPLHALAAAPPPGGAGPALLATCGAERTLVVYDARASRALRNVTGFMRKDVTSITFSSVDPRYIFAAGIDYEVLCRRWDAGGDAAPTAGAAAEGRKEPPRGPSVGGGASSRWAFRGYARWAGLAVDEHDTMAAFCASGAVYAARAVATHASAVDAGAAAAAPAGERDAYDD
jgi:hypothetical protein